MHHAYRFAVLFLSGASATAFAAPLKLNDIRSSIAQFGVSWQAEENGVAESLGIYKRSSPFGLATNPIDNEFYVETDQHFTPSALPAAVDWRNKEGINWMTPVRNQAFCGSCVAFAALGAFEGQLNITSQNPALNLDLSEQFLFGNIGSCNRGSIPSSANSSLKSKGAPDEACVPYSSGRMGSDTKPAACTDIAKRTYKIIGSKNVSGSGIKEALQLGPVTTTMTVYEDFMFYKEGIYQHITGSNVGGHAITIVGYDDAQGVWIVRNSWGESWGEKGYFRIPYGNDSRLGNSGTAFTVAAPGHMINLASPQYQEAIAGITTINVQKLTTEKLKSIQYSLRSLNSKTEATSGSIDPATLQTTLDTATLPDGAYNLALNAQNDTDKASTTWNSTIYIANQPQKVSMTLTPEFDLKKPVKDRVYVRLDIAFEKVPLSYAEMHFVKKDGSVEKSVRAEDPGNQTKVGWRTPNVPNGDYEVFAVGYIGNLQTFRSPSLSVTVKN